VKLLAFLTHPAQYLSPWFAQIASDGRVDLKVVYATTASAAQLGAEFGEDTEWNVPLRAGYSSVVLRERWDGPSLDARRAWSLDASGVRGIMRRFQPDVALLTGWHSLAQLRALGTFRAGGVPVLYRGDTTLTSMASGALGCVSSVRARLLLGQFSAFLAVGRRSREYLVAMGAPQRAIFDSPHAVDNERFAAAVRPFHRDDERRALRERLGISGDFVVLFVGKLQRIKRPLDVVAACAQMPGRVSLVIAGGGPLRQELEAAARAQNVRLHLLGVVDQQHLPDVYASADVLALPSASETWGLVVNEAMACGVPCVVSDGVGCAPDLIIPAETGQIYPAGDVTALAHALTRIQTCAARARLRDACQSHIQRYSYAAATAGLVDACLAVATPEPHTT
jgi:glycosyltransferase involved in cell wall biosynthesis